MGGSPFYEVISKENFNFMEDGFPNAIVMLSMLLLHLLHSPSFSEECNNIGYVDIDRMWEASGVSMNDAGNASSVSSRLSNFQLDHTTAFSTPEPEKIKNQETGVQFFYENIPNS